MNKESIFDLQNIDCNCNDCGYMTRDFEAFKKWESFHKQIQLQEFERKKQKAFEVAENCEDPKGKESLFRIANKMEFSFDKSGLMQYGTCGLKNNIQVSFIPNTCQIETQDCFKHRKTMCKS